MAEGLWRELSEEAWEVCSAGVFGAGRVHPMAMQVMQELGIGLGEQHSKSVEDFRGQRFDLMVTLCDNACGACPDYFETAEKLHWSIDDPTLYGSSEEERLSAFRRVRDDLKFRIEECLGGKSRPL